MSDGYIPDQVRRKVRDRAGNRCGYCLSPQHLVYGSLEIEHITPRAKGGNSDEDNLCLACRLCNNYKSIQTEAGDPLTGDNVRLFDPSRQAWSDHFSWSADGTRILGRTGCGRATVRALKLNNVLAIAVRREWVSVGWHPPSQGQGSKLKAEEK